MLIDIHVHAARRTGLLRQTGTRFPTPEELIEMMDAHGIDKAVLLCTSSPECRYQLLAPENILEICAEYSDRLIPFVCLDPRMLTNSVESDFIPLLTQYKDMGCVGIGEYIPNIPFDDPLNMNFFSQVEEVGFPLIFHIAHKISGTYGCYDEIGLPMLENALKAFPKLIFLGHSQTFWAEISSDLSEEDRGGYPSGSVVGTGRVVELMRKYPNLHGDLSANSGLNAIGRDPEFGFKFLEEFQDRLYFGTDIASYPQELPIVDYFQKLKQDALISSTAFEKITWQNASRLLGLEVKG